MKTATLPPLRVEPELRQQALRELRGEETLSSFVEEAVREHVERRRLQREFLARGLASAKRAKRTGLTYGIDDVMRSLERLSAPSSPSRRASRPRR